MNDTTKEDDFSNLQAGLEAVQDFSEGTATRDQQLTFEEIQQGFDTNSSEFRSVADSTEILEQALGKGHPLLIGLPNTRKPDSVSNAYEGKRWKKLQYIWLAYALYMDFELGGASCRDQMGLGKST